ncbi:hypothetical protein BCR35DRAFT_348890 [Leucosporidium creatinivorum]|uniref:NAD-dependent epimerase/dehydratase domain-containing protein n=1 Tax=Leucosporidium creatinivorum TaxID=106004 RepID=A0A1Y2G3J4_9BASI|nr:hypothetical protein BCR35DRAFT_348890 [Leucosporidium creatinivorum]
MPLLLLTGASGFAAASIALHALRRGFSVRLALRKQSQADLWRTKHGEEWKDKLQFAIVPDFAAPGAFDQAAEQVDYVIHTAQPFNWDPKDNKRDMLDPSINSVLELMRSSKKAGTVKAFVYTSSGAAYADHTQVRPEGYVIGEEDWCPITYEEAAVLPVEQAGLLYCAAKALTEKAAFKFIEDEQPNFTLTTLAAVWILGHNDRPDLTWANAKESSSYGKTARLLLDPQPEAEKGAPAPMPGVFISVHDLAGAHLNALTSPASFGHRYILSGGRLTYDNIVDLARKAVPEMAHRWIKPEGVPVMSLPTLDSESAERDLGFKYTSAEDTVAAMARQLFALEAEAKDAA